MIAVGESNAALRRIYFTIYVADGSALATDAAVSPPVGAVQVSVNGAAFTNALGALAHVGGGSYRYTADSTEIAAAGFLAVKFVRTGYRTELDWDDVGKIFSLGEAGATLLRQPFTVYDLSSPPALATGASITTPGDLKVSVNGAAYANVTGTMHEVGSGLYYYQAAALDASVVGDIILEFAPASTYATMFTVRPIIDATAVAFAPALTAATATGDLDADPDVARWVPVHIEFSVPAGFGVTIVAQIGLDSAIWMTPYDEGIGGGQGDQAMSPMFEDKTVVDIVGSVGTGRSFAIDVLPNGGWQRPDVKLVPYLTLEVT